MYRQSLALEKEMGRKEGIAQDYGNLARLRLAQSNPVEALEMAGRALALFSEMGAAPNIAKAEALIAEIRAAMDGAG